MISEYFSACQIGNPDIVLLLFEYGADGKIQNSRQISILYTAVQYGHINVVRCILGKIPELIHVSTID